VLQVVFRTALFLVLFSAISAPARADWYATPFIGFKFGTSTTFVDLDEAAELRKLTFGGAVTSLGDGMLGLEGEFGVIPGFFQRDPPGGLPDFDEDSNPCQIRCLVVSSRVTTMTGGIIVAAPRKVTGYSLRPYGTAGGGWMRATETAIVGEGFTRDLFTISVGGGLIGPLSPKRAVRFDMRYYRNVRTRGEGSIVNENRPMLGFWRASVGLMFKL
jgi:hypothetical protein